MLIRLYPLGAFHLGLAPAFHLALSVSHFIDAVIGWFVLAEITSFSAISPMEVC